MLKARAALIIPAMITTAAAQVRSPPGGWIFTARRVCRHEGEVKGNERDLNGVRIWSDGQGEKHIEDGRNTRTGGQETGRRQGNTDGSNLLNIPIVFRV